jgi:hypothetical protein
MGAYNTLKIKTKCNGCSKEKDLLIQFKYGDTWDYQYNLGEKLRWGGNDIGIEGAKKVALDGVSEPCKDCMAVSDYIIFLEKDVISSFEINQNQFHFEDEEGYYTILEK